MFGPRFPRDFGDAAPSIWQNAIQSLKDYEIARGFRRLAAHGSASPPTLPQFVKACKEVGDSEGPANPPRVPALPEPDFCKWKAFANNCMFKFLTEMKNGQWKRPPVTDPNLLQALIAEKNRVAEDYKLIASECEVTDAEFVKTCLRRLEEVFTKFHERKAA